MTREEVQKPILELFEGYASGRWNELGYVLRSFADDGEWWASGSLGLMTKAQLMEGLKQAGDGAAGGLVITPFSWIIEDDRAAVEANGTMPLKDGKRYRKQYHFVFQVKDGKVWRVRQYSDVAPQ